MNPTYKVGDIVQIISEEEVRSHPTDDCGNFILIPSIYGANDSFHRDKLPVCGCPAVITRISKGNERNLYDLTPLFAEDRTVFNWNDWFFSAAEFHPRVVSPPPVPSMSFDDLLEGVARCALFLDPLPNGNVDYIPPKRRSLCGSIMQIDRKLDASGFYFLKPYDLSTAVDPSAAAKFSWNSALFSPNEFHPYVTPVPVSPVSFDDFLKGGI